MNGECSQRYRGRNQACSACDVFVPWVHFLLRASGSSIGRRGVQGALITIDECVAYLGASTVSSVNLGEFTLDRISVLGTFFRG